MRKIKLLRFHPVKSAKGGALLLAKQFNRMHSVKLAALLENPLASTIFFCIIAGILFAFPSFLGFKPQEDNEVLAEESQMTEINQCREIGHTLLKSQGNTLEATSNHADPSAKVVWRLNTIITGYSSTPDQTDSTPFITAANTFVRPGIVAANFLPLGTKIRLPELYGDRIFVVEDRMHPRKHYLVDIWFPTREEALNFGAKTTLIEVLEG